MLRYYRGFSLVDVIVGIALMLVLFLALFGVLRASLMLSMLAKGEAGATAIAETQMEYLRGLSYGALGTVGGIPAGNVAQNATTTENGIAYSTHTFISYVDDPADDVVGVSDVDGATDYKRAEVAVSYTIGGQMKSVDLVSNFAPPYLEAAAGGGTLEINVVNSSGAPVADATVTIINASTTPTVDFSTFTNTAGVVSLPGAATSSSYQVLVTKNGYSTAQTYARNSINQNPNPGYLTVAGNQTTVGTFAIDYLSTLSLATFSPIATSTFADAFMNTSKLAVLSSTTVADGSLTLTSGALGGFARSNATTSVRLAMWGELMATTTAPSGTSVLLHVYDGSGTLLPDAVLPGNVAGFTSFPVALYSVSTTTYPSLAIGAELATISSSSPDVTGWSLSYTAGPTPIPNVTFTLTGAKTIGSTGSGQPIYKTVVTSSTGGSGTQNLTLEWDSYLLTLSGYDIENSCPIPPYVLAPGATVRATLTLDPATTNSLRVFVLDNAGNPVTGAGVTLARTGFSMATQSSSCGMSYFGNLASANDYSITITKPGYITTMFTGISVSGSSTYSASFP